MTGAVRNFNLKVLGWFWLTLLVCILSIAIPAFILQEINENEPLSGRDSRLLNNVAHLKSKNSLWQCKMYTFAAISGEV